MPMPMKAMLTFSFGPLTLTAAGATQPENMNGALASAALLMNVLREVLIVIP
jgi:hypothetical protein